MNSSIFSIVGATSTGKSDSVFHLANVALCNGLASGVDIISADSRQVYEGLAVLTGADVPEGFKKVVNDKNFHYSYYQKDSIRIHGLSCIKVSDDWSVSQFQNLAQEILIKALPSGRMVFVVGGTGLYHEHLFTLDPVLHIPPNIAVRARVEQMSVQQLQEWLARISPQRMMSMNNSDKHNPRRLQRAIEVAIALKDTEENMTQKIESDSRLKSYDGLKQHYFGLTLPESILEEKIERRVKTRFTEGAIAEVSAVREQNLPESTQALSSLGFAEVAAYLDGSLSQEECIQNWIQADVAYSHRQITWWKKNARVQWFDKSKPSYLEQLETSFLEPEKLP